MNLINEIIDRKIKGIDCTEYESAEIKGFLKENRICVLIACLFPLEFTEVIEELKLTHQ